MFNTDAPYNSWDSTLYLMDDNTIDFGYYNSTNSPAFTHGTVVDIKAISSDEAMVLNDSGELWLATPSEVTLLDTDVAKIIGGGYFLNKDGGVRHFAWGWDSASNAYVVGPAHDVTFPVAVTNIRMDAFTGLVADGPDGYSYEAIHDYENPTQPVDTAERLGVHSLLRDSNVLMWFDNGEVYRHDSDFSTPLLTGVDAQIGSAGYGWTLFHTKDGWWLYSYGDELKLVPGLPKDAVATDILGEEGASRTLTLNGKVWVVEEDYNTSGDVWVVTPRAEYVNTPIDSEVTHPAVGSTYDLGELLPGESATLTVTARFGLVTESTRAVNQAWVTSDQTPYERTPGTFNGAEAPDPAGTSANPTCNTSGVEDLCDEVDVSLWPRGGPLGSLSGLLWADTNHDGIRDEEETGRIANTPVDLYAYKTGESYLCDNSGLTFWLAESPWVTNDESCHSIGIVTSEPVRVGTTMTASDGTYSFAGLPAGEIDRYKVVFPLTGVSLGGASLALSPQRVAGATPETNSDADSLGATSGWVVVAGEDTSHVDAGVWTTNPHMSVSKTFVHDGAVLTSAELPLLAGTGTTDPVVVTVKVVNDGDEPLRDITLVDDQTGKALPDFTCTPALSGLVLAPGAQTTCTSTLSPLQAGEFHADTATVRAVGDLSGTLLVGEGTVTITTPGREPAITVKKYVNDASDAAPSGSTASGADSDAQTSGTAVLDPDGTFTTTYVVTNTGNVVLTGVVVKDTVNGTDVAIGGTCPKTTLAPGESMVCHGTQTTPGSGIFDTPAHATGLAHDLDGNPVGVSDTDEAFVLDPATGSVKVVVWFSVDGTGCESASDNCIALDEVPTSIGGHTGSTDAWGQTTTGDLPLGSTEAGAAVPGQFTPVSTTVDGAAVEGAPASTTVDVVEDTTRVVVITVTSPQQGPVTPNGEPKFESGI